MNHSFDNILKDFLGERPFLLSSIAGIKERQKINLPIGKKSGTTILAMHYKDGVVMAADCRTTDWHLHTDDAVKIEEIGELSTIGCAGTVAFIQDLKETLSFNISRFENMIEAPIFIDGQTNILKNILKDNFEYYAEAIYFFGYAVPILAGFHPEQKRGMIFEFDEVGGIYEKSTYATTGSGGTLACSILDHSWKTNMNEADAVDLAMQALASASTDNYSSPPLMAPATVAVISGDKGIRYLDKKRALAMALTNYLDYLKRHGKKEEFEFFSGGEV